MLSPRNQDNQVSPGSANQNQRRKTWHKGLRKPEEHQRHHRPSLQALAFTTKFASAPSDLSPRAKEYLVYIRLNIGGTPYRLSEATILKRCEFGLLHRFASANHEQRLELCDDYDQASGEYFFQRSGAMFQPIYLYYLNGIRLHVPLYLREQFIEELSHWGLAKLFYPNQIARRQRLEARDLSLIEKFQCVHFGEIRQHIWHLLETPESSKMARLFALVSIAAVLLSNLTLVLSSMKQFQIELETSNGTMVTQAHPLFEHIEYGCIALFTSEFVAKFLVTPEKAVFFKNFMNLIDFIAIAPFYFELTINNLGFDSSHLQNMQGPFLMMRILRVMRVIRLFKLGRHSTGLRVFVKVIWSTVLQLGVVMAVVGIGLMFFSTLIYYLERDVPGSPFYSIPATSWWCIVTMTTVGYGDMVPETTGGKLVGSCAIAMGVLVLSMPITIFVDRFMNVQDEEEIGRN